MSVLCLPRKYQYENMQVSSPIRLKHSERIILGVDRQFCIVKAVDWDKVGFSI